MIRPPRWTSEQLAKDCDRATEAFRRKRMEEPLEDYLEAFDDYQGDVEALFEATLDLTDLDSAAIDVLTDPKLLDAFRYLGGPPISNDDLKTIAEAAAQAPGSGEFCAESLLGTRKADFILRLWDQRIMPIECKVSNSATNSVKRLNNDAAVKAETWKSDFGKTQVVPCAVLSGVYKLHNLEDAQHRGLALFWAHDLKPMLDWIERTRQAYRPRGAENRPGPHP